jgi:hypothetical protein
MEKKVAKIKIHELLYDSVEVGMINHNMIAQLQVSNIVTPH